MSINVGGRDVVKGFDWSMHQPPRSFRPAVEEGHQFVVLKATEGVGYGDPAYAAHAANARDAGLLTGAYHFARPSKQPGISAFDDGRNEAAWFLSVIDPRTDFVVLDLEATSVSDEETTDFVLGFWHEIIRSGRFAQRERRVTYVGTYFTWAHAAAVADASVLWVPAYTANYQRDPDPTRIALPRWCADIWPEGWTIWQYTSSGTVAGHFPSDVNVATVEWVESIRSGRSLPTQTYDPQGEWFMRPINISGESVQYELVIDGFGNRRRRAIATLAEAEVLAAAGVLAGQDQLLVLDNPEQIAAFNSFPPVGLGGEPVLADMGALKLAVETWRRIEELNDDVEAPTEGDDIVSAVHDLGDYLKRYEPHWQTSGDEPAAST